MPQRVETEVKDAIRNAKGWLSEVLADESPINIGLDEIEYDERASQWKITIGFSRPWNTIQSNALTNIAGTQGTPRRSYRTITIDAKTGKVLSMRRRQSGDD